MPAHQLDDHHALVRFGGRVETVERLGRYLDRGVESEREVGARQVVVDRLRHADDADALLEQLVRHTERVLAADRDERVELRRFQRVLDLLDAVRHLERVRARGAEDRSAPRQEPGNRFRRQCHRLAVDRPFPAVAEADHDITVDVGRLAHDGADDRVEARRISAAGEHPDPHEPILTGGYVGLARFVQPWSDMSARASSSE